MEKITTYTAIGDKLEKETENLEEAIETISYAMCHISTEKASELLLKWNSEGKYLITVYPEFGEVDTSAWELVGDVMDGALYVGKME